MKETNGRVVYVATGEGHIREAVESIESLWRYNPELKVTLYLDDKGRQALADLDSFAMLRRKSLDLVDHPYPTYSPLDKATALRHGEFDRVLYLDTDTRVCGSIGEIFDLLDVFDLAAAQDAIRFAPRQPKSLVEQAPSTFPELNTGVIAFRRSDAVNEFLEKWRLLHDEALKAVGSWVGDQGSFRVALFDSDVRFTVLTPEYNFHIPFPTSLDGPVRILHGRWPAHPAVIEKSINRIHGPRAYVPGLGTFRTSLRLIMWRRRYYAWREQGTLRLLRSRIKRWSNRNKVR